MCSTNGTLLAASVRFESSYASRDGGATWVVLQQNLTYSASLAASGNTVKQAAAVRGSYVFVSDNEGRNWTARVSAGKRLWRAIASSADGDRLAAAEESGFIYTSEDRGLTWKQRTGTGSLRWAGLASSANGSVLVGSAYNQTEAAFYLLASTDGGSTWAKRPAKSGYTMAASADGTRLLAAAWGGYLSRSVDGGRNWATLTAAGAQKWSSVASSASGVKLFAAVYGGFIHTSTDGGATWTPPPPG